MSTFVCHVCKKTNPMQHNSQHAYVQVPGGHRICCDCYGAITATDMLLTGKATLYLILHKEPGPMYVGEVRDFFGVLRFPCTYMKQGAHNIAGRQIRFRFVGPDGCVWSGMQVGDNQVAHCERNEWKSVNPPVPPPRSFYFHPFPYPEQQQQNHEQNGAKEN